MTKNEALLKKTLRHSQNGQKGQRTECRATQPRTANLVGWGPWCCWTFWKSRFTSCHRAPGSWPSYHPCHQHGEDCCHPWENFLKPRWDLISHARNWQQSQWHVLLQGFGKTVPSYTATVSAKGTEGNLAKAGKMTRAPVFDPATPLLGMHPKDTPHKYYMMYALGYSL